MFADFFLTFQFIKKRHLTFYIWINYSTSYELIIGHFPSTLIYIIVCPELSANWTLKIQKKKKKEYDMPQNQLRTDITQMIAVLHSLEQATRETSLYVNSD